MIRGGKQLLSARSSVKLSDRYVAGSDTRAGWFAKFVRDARLIRRLDHRRLSERCVRARKKVPLTLTNSRGKTSYIVGTPVGVRVTSRRTVIPRERSTCRILSGDTTRSAADRLSSGAMARKLNDHRVARDEAPWTSSSRSTAPYACTIGFNMFVIMVTRRAARSRSPCVTFACILSFRSAGPFKRAWDLLASIEIICSMYRSMSRLIDARDLTITMPAARRRVRLYASRRELARSLACPRRSFSLAPIQLSGPACAR